MKKALFVSITLALAQSLFALDLKYADIVKTALADLKTHTKLSLMKGHAAIHVSSGNKDLDKQLGEELQKAYPALTSKADTVRSEDLYELTAKVYREGGAVFVEMTLADYKKQKLIDRTASVKKVPAAVLETLQYKSALRAKNEFETYLDSTFGTTSAVVHEARRVPKPPKKPLIQHTFNYAWTELIGGVDAAAIFSGASSVTGYDVLAVYPFIGVAGEWKSFEFLLSTNIGGGLSAGSYPLISQWGGDVELFIKDNVYILSRFSVGLGLGIAGGSGNTDKEKDATVQYPFIRSSIGFNAWEIGRTSGRLKLYFDYNFGGNGVKIGVLLRWDWNIRELF